MITLTYEYTKGASPAIILVIGGCIDLSKEYLDFSNFQARSLWRDLTMIDIVSEWAVLLKCLVVGQ